MQRLTLGLLTQAVRNYQVLLFLVVQLIIQTTIHGHGNLVDGHEAVKVLGAIARNVNVVKAHVQVPRW